MNPFQSKINFLLKKKVSPSITPVLVEEEFGYRMWIWFPKLNYKKLHQWWSNLERLDKFNMQEQFWSIGSMMELYPLRTYNKIIKIEKYIHKAFVFDDTDSILVPPRWIGDYAVTHKYYEESNRELMESMNDLRE